jgi:hypothetical protein
MPDPIRGATADADLSASYPTTEELSSVSSPLSTASNQCLASPPEMESGAADGAAALVDKYSQKDYSAFIANESAAPTPTPTPAQGPEPRVTFFSPTHLRDSQGFTEGGSVVKAQTSLGNAEALSVSVQGGAQNSVQAGVLHFAPHAQVFGVNLSGSADALNLRANLGIHNDDGSTGANIGAMATAAGVEVTAEHSGWSATLGLSESVGVAVSSGEGRDGDGDLERCFKLSIGPATVGFCSEF